MRKKQEREKSKTQRQGQGFRLCSCICQNGQTLFEIEEKGNEHDALIAVSRHTRESSMVCWILHRGSSLAADALHVGWSRNVSRKYGTTWRHCHYFVIDIIFLFLVRDHKALTLFLDDHTPHCRPQPILKWCCSSTWRNIQHASCGPTCFFVIHQLPTFFGFMSRSTLHNNCYTSLTKPNRESAYLLGILIASMRDIRKANFLL